MKKQGANNGAATAFLISTPESGVDSIAVTWAMLDPVMTVMRPVAALCTAVAAGVTENLLHWEKESEAARPPDRTCPVDGCCDGVDCPPDEHARHHTLFEKLKAAGRFAAREVWGDMAGYFFVGLILAGLITVLVPGEWIAEYLGGGLPAMLLMLAIGVPMYICATASTPIAAALILKGVSPGAALVFLLAGPATNIASLSVVLGTLGKRATVVYLGSIAVMSVLFGLLVDSLYAWLGLAPQAAIGQAAEIVPEWLGAAGAVLLLALSIRPIGKALVKRVRSLAGRRSNYGKHSAGAPIFSGSLPDFRTKDPVCRKPGCGCGRDESFRR